MRANPVLPLETFKKEGADKQVSEIYMTYEYEKFKVLEGNRVVSKTNLARITQSMKEKHLMSPITVNENFEIVDGQHRFTASKELHLPVYYFIMKGAALSDVQRLNAVSKTWSFIDYMESYCQLGYPEYLKVKRFRQDFPDLSITPTMCLLSLNIGTMSISSRVDGGKTNESMSFAGGTFKCANLSRSYELAGQIMQLKEVTNLYNRTGFVAAFVSLSRKPQFEFKNFKQKAQKFPNMLYECTSTKNYIGMIEEIYNYRNRNKVSLRF